MSTVRPFGDPTIASILVIGHDPRLQNSLAEAEKAFSFEHLEKYSSRPTSGPDARKYDLAYVIGIINKLGLVKSEFGT